MAARGLGPIDDAGFVKVYEGFTGKRVAGANEGEQRQMRSLLPLCRATSPPSRSFPALRRLRGP